MALAGAGRAEQMHHLGAVDEVELGERQDAVAVERGLEGEVEAGERLDRGQPRQLQRRLDAAVLADGQFLDEQLIEGFDAVDLALLDPAEGGVEHLQGTRHPQRHQAVLDAVEGGGSGMDGHDRPPDDGEALADGLIEGQRAMRDMIADPADDDGVSAESARRPRGGALSMAGIDPVLPAPFQDRMGGDEPALHRGCGSGPAADAPRRRAACGRERCSSCRRSRPGRHG